jgi:hypothetical protein
LQHEVNQLCSVRSDLEAVEKLALDAYVASSEEARDTLSEVDGIVPLNIPQLPFNQLPTIRESRGKS